MLDHVKGTEKEVDAVRLSKKPAGSAVLYAEGFKIESEQIEIPTKEKEYTMTWNVVIW